MEMLAFKILAFLISFQTVSNRHCSQNLKKEQNLKSMYLRSHKFGSLCASIHFLRRMTTLQFLIGLIFDSGGLKRGGEICRRFVKQKLS